MSAPTPNASWNRSFSRLVLFLITIAVGVSAGTAAPPVISTIVSRSMAANSTSPSIVFAVSDPETIATGLVVFSSSSDTTLVPTNRIALSGTSTNRSVRITPVLDKIGTCLITLTVRDPAGETASSSFQLSVTNGAPSISDIANRMVNPGVTSSVISFVVYDKETSPSNLVVSVLSSNPALIPTEKIYFGGYGSNRTFRVLPEMQLGTSTITFTVTDSIGATAKDSFDLVVTNAKPSITYGTDIVGVMNRTSPPSTFVVGDLETAAEYLQISGYSSDQTLLSDSGLLFGGSGSNRFVNVVPNLNQVGTTQIRLVVSDQFNGRATNQINVTISQFGPVTNELPGFQYTWLAWGDYDRDGVLDYAILGSPATTSIYRGLGDGTFTNINANLLGMESGSLEWVDYDRDGDLDLLAAGSTAAGVGATRLYRNDGGVFVIVPTGLPDLSYARMAWGDFDNDGDSDLFLSGESNQVAVTKLFRNDHGTFVDTGVSFPRVPSPAVAWGDFDSDGDLDLFYSSASAAYVYRNAGDGAFLIVGSFPGLGGGTAQWGDYDGDGDLDVLLHGGDNRGAGFTVLFRNDKGVFTKPSVGLTYEARTGAQWGDYDNDGDLDVAIGYRYEQFATIFYRNDGGSYVDSSNRVASVGSGALAWGDCDNDGLLDLLQTGSRDYPSYAKLTKLFRNYGPVTNTPPAQPSGLSAEVSGRTVQLSWNASTDVNQTNLLTYNLRVGITPGGGEVLSPSALQNGKRLVPGFGNVWLNRSWRLRDLAPETYYATVQAVDAGFAASPFSSEVRFTIAAPPSAPSASTELPTAITYREATFHGSGSANGLSTMSWFEFGVTPALGTKTPATPIGIGTGYVPLSAIVTNLLPNTDYFVRSAVSNSAGTNYGELRTFTTLPFSAFSEMTDLLPGADAAGGKWVDYDTDGDLDIVGPKIIRNTAGNFTTVGSTTNNPGTWSDFNNDNVPDELWSRGVQINNRNGSFSNTTLTLALTVPEYAVGASAWGDFDNDGDLDLLISGQTIFYEYYATGLYRNEGNWQFTTVSNSMPASLGGAPGWLDYDNDGWLDAFLSGFRWLPQPAYLYHNTAGLDFADSGATLSGGEVTCRDWADFDNDGDLDLAVGPATRIYRNDGGGVFTLVATNLPASSQISWGDFDNDGFTDLLLVSPDPTYWRTALVCRNEGNGAFSTNNFRADGATSATWGDYDRDGDLDIFTYGSINAESITRIYRNNCAVSNPPPSAPTGLQSTFDGKSVKLSWTAPSDANQSGGCSFNLRVGRTHGGTEVLSPMSDGTNGFHYVARMGNAGLSTGWVMTNLPVGTYYWSVQAIDHGLASSRFATEQTLVIPAWPPEIVSVSFTNPTLSTATLQGRVNPNSLSTLVWFEYGTTTGYGQTSETRWLPGATTTLATNIQVAGLAPLAQYHYRMAASNALGKVYSADQTFSTIQFTEAESPMKLSQSWHGAWTDFNGDGLLDAFVNGYNGTTYAGFVELNNGDGTFREASSIPFGYRVGAAINLDKDTDIDLLLPGNYRPIYNNNGLGILTENTNSMGFTVGLIIPGDVDNDGDIDLLVAGDDSANYKSLTLVLTNNGYGQFSDSRQTNLIQCGGGLASWADTDDDGDLDLVFSGNAGSASTNFTRLYRNDGPAGFTPLPGLFPYVSSGAIAWADYDNDGDLDAIITGYGTNGYLTRLYRKDGPNLFTEVDAGIAGMSSGSAQWGDFDNDGRPDLLLTGYTNGSYTATHIYRNLGGDQFQRIEAEIPGVLNGVAAWGDYDIDGDLDILLAGQYVPGNIYRNNALTPNPLPQAPRNLAGVVINGNSALLSWEPGIDPNQTGGHSFNLRVGTAPGLSDVMDANANWPTGVRKIPGLGNALTSAHFLLKSLKPGTYFWSVQAIDHSWAGSPFAAEQSFSVLPFTQPPSLSVLPATNVAFFTALLRAAVNPNGVPSIAWFEYGSGTNYGSQTTPIAVGAGESWVELNLSVSNLVSESAYHWRAVASNLNGVTFGLDQSFTTLPYVLFTQSAQLLEFSDGSADWGDYDNDGDLDLLVTGLSYESGNYTRCRIYQNNGGSFTNAVNIPVGAWQGDARWGDYDNDGDLDIVVCGNSDQAGNTARIYRNDGPTTFTLVPVTLPAVYEGRTAWADVDRDGDLDLVLVSSTSSGVYRNDGHDTFVLWTNLLTVSSGNVSLADYDNDGDLDILLMGYASGSVARLYVNNGRGEFASLDPALPKLTTGAADWADIDGDGDLDLALVGNMGGSPVTYFAGVFRNDGNGVFTDLQAGLQGVSYSTCSFGDYDNDGDPDLLITGMALGGTRLSKVYRNIEGTMFVDSGAALQPTAEGRAVWGDYDNDGDLDFAQVGVSSMRVYRNNAVRPNVAPQPPGDLGAVTWQDAAMLYWSAPTDANQNGGLTYNVRIGSAPGASDVLGPMANSTNGWRRVAQRGNAGTLLWLAITNLPAGTYYWSVQAIDNSYAGSSFAPELMFNMESRAPDVLTGKATNITETTALLSGFVSPNGAASGAWFQYGAGGYTDTTTPQPVGGGYGRLSVSTPITNLMPGEVYHFRLVATNSYGTSYGADQVFVPPMFTEIETPFAQVKSGSLMWGDYDRDRNLDLVLTGETTNFVNSTVSRLYHNNGNGTFSEVTAGIVPAVLPGNWGDYDNDGDLDLLLLTRLYRFNGNAEGFSAINAGLPQLSYPATAWGDFDNDGKLDILCAGFAGGSGTTSRVTQIYRSIGGGAFVNTGANMQGVENASVAWGDYDNDGDLDVLRTGFNTGGVRDSRVYRNNGNGTFTSTGAFMLTGVTHGSAVWGDYDNDGDLDVLLTGESSGGSVSKVYRNEGADTFVEAVAGLPGVLSGTGLWADYDNDGDLDIFLSGQGTNGLLTKIYRNNGAGIFSDSSIELPGMTDVAAAWGDFDNDGDLDLVVSGYTQDSSRMTKLFRNNNRVPNAAPSTPSALSARPSGTGVRLTWSGSTDSNQAYGLSYNVRVGSTPGGNDILSAMAEPQSGKLQLAAIGNAQLRTFCMLTNIPGGTYYWSVQAVDQSFASSSFASEGTFSITNHAPVADPVQIVLGEDFSAAVVLSGSDQDLQPLSFRISAQPQNGVLSGTPPNLIYQPATNFFGGDSFTYVATDGAQDSLAAKVSLIVTQRWDTLDPKLGIYYGPFQPARLTLRCEPYEQYQIQSSADLIHWFALTNVLSTNGLVELLLGDAANHTKLFFRAELFLPAATLQPYLDPTSHFSLLVTGEPGRRYRIESSINLEDWVAIDEFLIIKSPTEFTDPNATSGLQKYYRVIAVP